MEIGKNNFPDNGIETLVGYDTSNYRISFDHKFVKPNNKQFMRLQNFIHKYSTCSILNVGTKK